MGAKSWRTDSFHSQLKKAIGGVSNSKSKARQGFRPILECLEDRIAPAIVTPFTPRFSINTTGDIVFAANTLLTAIPDASHSAQTVANAQNGVGSVLNNNDFNMGFVDVDNDPTTFDSSQATLSLPPGATVLFAGLYWGAESASNLRTQVKFQVPNGAGYVDIQGAELGNSSGITPVPQPAGNNYEAFADVTGLVSAAGNGTYTVANVQADTGSNHYAGWSLVVVYQDPSLTIRNLTVFDGYSFIRNGDPNVTIPVKGFLTPLSGPVNAQVGVIAYEGDLGFTGDSLSLNGTKLSDAANPANNFFNSSISDFGVTATSKSPNFVNQLGFDADIVAAPPGVIQNGDTSATLTLSTTGDTYFPGVLTTVIDLLSPNIQTTKTVTDLTHANGVQPGDILQYTITVADTASDAGINTLLVDSIPANTHYVANSLQITAGANAGAKTDAAGDDQAEFNSAANQVVFRLGAGANATTGGQLNIGDSTTVTFQVQVDPNTPNQTPIDNVATTTSVGLVSNVMVTSTGSASTTVVFSQADLALTKTVSNATPNVGDTITFTVTLSNNGPNDATGIVIADLLPQGLTFVGATPSQGTYDSTTGNWAVGSLAHNAAPVTLTIQAHVDSPSAKTNTATVSALDQTDPNLANNTASATEAPVSPPPNPMADLALTKSVDVATPNVGDTINFTVTLTNNGPDPATNVAVSDPLPAGLTFVSSTPSLGTYDSQTGVWTVGAISNGGSSTLTLKATVTSPNQVTNIATVSHSDQTDPNSGNNMASASETPQRADLAVTKVVDKPAPHVGDTVTFTVTVTNNGLDAATNVTVNDSLPSELSLISATPSQGTFNSTTGLWTVGTLANGASQTLIIQAKVQGEDAQANTAAVAHSDQFDPDISNNSAIATETPVLIADVVMTKLADNPTPLINGLVNYRLIVRNDGPNTATNVSVTDSMIAGIQFIFAGTPTQGSFNPITQTWSVGSLASGITAEIDILARVIKTGSLLNQALATASSTDPNLANNLASATVNVTTGGTITNNPNPPLSKRFFLASTFNTFLGAGVVPGGPVGVAPAVTASSPIGGNAPLVASGTNGPIASPGSGGASGGSAGSTNPSQDGLNTPLFASIGQTAADEGDGNEPGVALADTASDSGEVTADSPAVN